MVVNTLRRSVKVYAVGSPIEDPHPRDPDFGFLHVVAWRACLKLQAAIVGLVPNVEIGQACIAVLPRVVALDISTIQAFFPDHPCIGIAFRPSTYYIFSNETERLWRVIDEKVQAFVEIFSRGMSSVKIRPQGRASSRRSSVDAKLTAVRVQTYLKEATARQLEG